MTSRTMLAASVARVVMLSGFASAVIFGIAVATFSSKFVFAPRLLQLPGRLPGRQPEGVAG